ncbi:cobalt-zinc-cadmium resistance protein CzcA [Bradyrhizobium sp. JR7.2]|jgi:cobalt-zinc-cadmium resistance protein CzcA|uniref:CusA/CzcA family heavy metal efflux RND transporter n=3 Tax=Bradyrhizobium TaxID=374 RepID=A0A7Z0QEL2_9BRAD|nr:MULTISPECIES: CusA/CzcA family heavy metal efflux RND transporter [Bradyrhizobium]OSJ26196.1 CusA/CzcA family heavy metal efflux RND transporter [Bradyrhizobium japonicum]TFW60238.1 efflux RND transporter permease subunit [Bradyrhizobium sp. MOS001]UFW89404.1 CusA/CzcA family heavy metal efflux RND transporter [Bradyrhizobium japonicum]UGX90980.1 CusA/CzcA family heavy metal efflux RND transporter [Bradyrhizobium barranii subsp. barranii]WFT98164.1 CusA/CzcA family heavy metal efflux RND tr
MDRLVALAVNRRFLMVGMFFAVLIGGLIAFNQLNIEAYPDPTPPMVDIVTQSPGLSAEEIERYITIPIETQVAGLKNLTTIRTISLYGLSDIKLQFSFAYTYDEAQQQVLNRLAQLAPLPGNVQPQISPLSPIGEIFRYRLVGPPNYSVLDLKTIQDWILQRRFRAVPGVIDVTGWGGKSKTYELQVDFNKLVANGLTLPQLLQAVSNSNVNVGGNTVNIGQQSAVVRGVGLIRSIDDLANTMVSQTNGNPVLVKDVATVTVGQKPRLGIAGIDDSDDIVQGIVLMRRGEQSSPTIKRVHQLVQTINNSSILPPGVRIERIYDRGDLIELTTHTVLHNMVVGILLIVLLQWMFLGDLRSALIVGATIPFALFFAVIILVLRGESANLLSVGAIDFGLIVDATVIMVEAIFRRLTQTTPVSESEQMSPETLFGMKSHAILSAAADVSRSIFFAAAIIIAAFLPLFTLSGVEGNIFGPMARTYAYALAGGLLATFTVTPALSAIILPAHLEETETRVMRILHRIYMPVLNWAVANRGIMLGGAVGLVLMTVALSRLLGLEFLPKLEEGNLWIRATLPPTISLQEGNTYVNEMRKLIRARPEVESVVSQHGRPDDGTDAAGFFNAEFFAPLKPASQWPGTHDKEELTAQLLKQLDDRFPGVEFNFSQYLQDNVSEAVSGVKGENSIKLFGSDLQALTDTANKIKSVLATVQGVTDLAVFTSLGQPTIQIDIDRAKAARYGLAPGDINATIKVAIGGDTAGDLYEPGSDRHFPIIVRLAPEYRRSAEAIQNLRIGAPGPNGTVTQIPLSEVATISLVSGAAYIYREQQERYLPIKFSVRERDLGSAIREAQQKVAEQVQLPPGAHMDWVGEFGNLQDAIRRLSIVVPISLALIGVLLWFNFGSMTDTLLAMSVIPMAIFGGVLGLLITGTAFSVSAAIGFIALFGIAVMDGIIILSQFNQLIEEGMDRVSAVIRTGELQLRPVLMTCVVAGVGLLPAALSEGIGSQVQKPLAVVVVTGMMLAPVVILVTLPVLISFFSRRAR